MNHNFYLRHEERLAEIRREVEHLRLLKAAGLSEPGWVARAGKAIRNWLAMRTRRQQVDTTIDYRSYQGRSDGLPQ
jgi:hypothetical protein